LPEFKLKIVDFNYAKQEEKNETNLGTFMYASPEILLQKSDLFTKKIDIWSLGTILYEM
jgi:serine/threonine protein kinase